MKKNEQSGLKRKFHITVEKKRNLKGLLFVAPWIVGFVLFFAYPLIQSVEYSLSNIVNTANGRKITFIGIENYLYIFQKDIYFTDRLVNFFLSLALSLPLVLVFSLMLAMLINQRIRGKGIFRTIFFLPIIVVSGPVLEMLTAEGANSIPFIEKYGLISAVNSLPQFLAEPVADLLSRLIMILWYSGVPIMIFLAGLQKIDTGVYEAAYIDGASSWVAFWKITLPSIRGMILINAVYTTVFLATNETNEVISLIRNDMMTASKGFGIASAMAWVYTLSIGLALIICVLIIGNEKVKKAK